MAYWKSFKVQLDSRRIVEAILLAARMKYSLIIPYYKAERYFDKTLNSVLQQSVLPEEILVIDDEVSEASRSFLQRYQSDLVKIVTLPRNGGVANARNVGIGLAKCEWLAFLDADDLWEENKIEIQQAYLRLNPGWDGCHTGVRVFSEAKGVTAEYINKPSVLAIDDLLMGSHMTPPSLFIKKDVVAKLGGMDINFSTSSDYDFSIRLVKAGYRLGFVPLPLISVRRSNHGNLSSIWHRTFFNHCRLVRKHRDIFIHRSGYRTARRFLAKSLRESSGKLGGVRGRCLYQLGKLFG